MFINFSGSIPHFFQVIFVRFVPPRKKRNIEYVIILKYEEKTLGGLSGKFWFAKISEIVEIEGKNRDDRGKKIVFGIFPVF